jgi:polygalacturonase
MVALLGVPGDGERSLTEYDDPGTGQGGIAFAAEETILKSQVFFGAIVVWFLALTTGTAQGLKSRKVDAATFGIVVNDGQSDTKALQSAIDHTHALGGGCVVLPEGETLCGTIHLRSNVTLEVPLDAVLRASDDRGEYGHGAWLFAQECSHVSICGKGKLVGNGTKYFDISFGRVAQWIAKGSKTGLLEHPVEVRPLCFHFMLQFIQCKHVSLHDIQINDSQHWTVHFLACDNVECSKVSIRNSIYGPYTDGFDIDGSSSVVIRDCDVTAGDDAFCVKNTNKRNLARKCEGVLIENCIARSPTNAFKIGTETHASISDVTFRRCRVDPPFPGVFTLSGVTITTVDGGNLNNIEASDIHMSGVRAPVFIRLGNRSAVSKPDSKPGELRRVRIRNVTVDRCTSPITISGIDGYSIHDVEFDDVFVATRQGAVEARASNQIPENISAYPESTMFGQLPATILFARHVDGLTLRNVSFRRSANIESDPPSVFQNVTGIIGDIERLESAGISEEQQRTKP